MEHLPDELLLLIFRYLHKFDRLYSIQNLNRRFQQIIEPYQYNIDLTEQGDVSYQHFLIFINHILPIQGTKIQSLTMNGYHQIQLLRPYLRFFTNLKSFTLKSNNKMENLIYGHQLKQFLTDILLISSSISELSIFGTASEIMLQTISSCTSKNLTKLTLLSQDGYPNFKGVLQISSIKCLSINLQSIDKLVKIFQIMPNLEELKLSVLFLHNLQNIDRLQVPKTLEKLHLEFVNYKKYGTQPSTVRIKKILNGFKNQLHSLTIIILNALKEFSNLDEFQSLTDNFTHLRIFEYYVRTNYQPNSLLFPNVQQLFGPSYSFYTLPQPKSFDTISNRTTVKYIRNSNRSLQDLFDCTTLEFSDDKRFQTEPTCLFQLTGNIKFINLKELQIHISNDDIKPEVYRFLPKVISLSPNLNTLNIWTKYTTKIIQQLTKMFSIPSQSKQIIHLTYGKSGEENNYSKFFYNLSKIFPNLKTITFPYDISSLGKDSLTIVTNHIPELRNSFTQLIHFKTEIQRRDILEKCKQVFNENQQQTEYHLGCFSYEIGPTFNIWF